MTKEVSNYKERKRGGREGEERGKKGGREGKGGEGRGKTYVQKCGEPRILTSNPSKRIQCIVQVAEITRVI